MKVRAALLLLPAVLALSLSVVGARAAAPRGGLDPSFGDGGIARTVAPKPDHTITDFAVAPEGRVYLLDDAELLAFESNGEVAHGFGEDGVVTIGSPVDETAPVGVAIDPQGRILLTGSKNVVSVPEQTEAFMAYVIRLLPDGSRDPSFGVDGEVDTDFGLPAPEPGKAAEVEVFSIAVDAEGRPILGGGYGKGLSCFNVPEAAPKPFFARLTATGALDPTFGEAGRVLLRGSGVVSSVAETAGGLAVFDTECGTPPRYEGGRSYFSFFDEGGAALPGELERLGQFGYGGVGVDPRGRLVGTLGQLPTSEGEFEVLTRYLPTGRLDRSFGDKGELPLRGRALRGETHFALDPRGRPVFLIEGGITLRRLHPNGALDRQFGPGGKLQAKGDEPSALAFNAEGRIYTAAVARTKTQTVVEVARFIPGR
jgi:uncharacterized delta-60 repeat protein